MYTNTAAEVKKKLSIVDLLRLVPEEGKLVSNETVKNEFLLLLEQENAEIKEEEKPEFCWISTTFTHFTDEKKYSEGAEGRFFYAYQEKERCLLKRVKKLIVEKKVAERDWFIYIKLLNFLNSSYQFEVTRKLEGAGAPYVDFYEDELSISDATSEFYPCIENDSKVSEVFKALDLLIEAELDDLAAALSEDSLANDDQFISFLDWCSFEGIEPFSEILKKVEKNLPYEVNNSRAFEFTVKAYLEMRKIIKQAFFAYKERIYLKTKEEITTSFNDPLRYLLQYVIFKELLKTPGLLFLWSSYYYEELLKGLVEQGQVEKYEKVLGLLLGNVSVVVQFGLKMEDFFFLYAKEKMWEVGKEGKEDSNSSLIDDVILVESLVPEVKEKVDLKNFLYNVEEYKAFFVNVDIPECFVLATKRVYLEILKKGGVEDNNFLSKNIKEFEKEWAIQEQKHDLNSIKTQQAISFINKLRKLDEERTVVGGRLSKINEALYLEHLALALKEVVNKLLIKKCIKVFLITGVYINPVKNHLVFDAKCTKEPIVGESKFLRYEVKLNRD